MRSTDSRGYHLDASLRFESLETLEDVAWRFIDAVCLDFLCTGRRKKTTIGYVCLYVAGQSILRSSRNVQERKRNSEHFAKLPAKDSLKESRGGETSRFVCTRPNRGTNPLSVLKVEKIKAQVRVKGWVKGCVKGCLAGLDLSKSADAAACK